MNNNTLTRRLFLRTAPTIIITIAAIGLFAFYSATREINHVYDAQLINNANVLWRLVEDEFHEAGAELPKQFEDVELSGQINLNEDVDDYASARMFRIWKSGKIVMFSNTAPPVALPPQSAGLSDIVYENEKWRIYSLPIADTSISVEVGEKAELRHTLVINILLDIAFPLLLLIPGIVFLLWAGIRSSLDTIRRLMQQVRHRSPEDLSPINTQSLPRDLLPLEGSINELLDKLQNSLTAERRFADHAAHQLRTPLASVKLLLQMLAKADSTQEREIIWGNLVTSNNRAQHLVEQLLQAARVSHQPLMLRPVSLYNIAASVIAEMAQLISQKSLNISLEGNEGARVLADETLLRLLLSNLIDNALKYTPPYGTVEISVQSAGEQWMLAVEDSGPGIPAEQRVIVFERFYRSNISDQEGTGLGLAIVANIIERLSGSIFLKEKAFCPGLIVEIMLPRA